MNPKAKLALALILLALCFTGSAKAMSIDDFAFMNNDDEATYVTLLVNGAADMLKTQGQSEQARKILSFFKDSSKDGGVHQFADHLRTAESLNNRNATNPNNRMPVYQVEDALSLTLKDNGIIVPASALLTIGKDFVPVGPPRARIISQ